MSLEHPPKTANIRDVAEYSGVSVSTVSRILNNKGPKNWSVTPERREAVLQAAKALNYVPNINAKRLFSKRSGVIGFLVPHHAKMGKHIFDDNHVVRILSGIENSLDENNYHLLLLFCNEKFIAEKRYLSLFKEHNIDGLLIWGADIQLNCWSELASHPYPCIFLTNVPELTMPINFINSHYANAGYLASRHLLKLGHRRLLWLGTHPEQPLNSTYLSGIQRAMLEFNIPPDSLIQLHGDYKEASGKAAIDRYLDQPGPPEATGIVVLNEEMAIGVVESLNRHHLRIPDDFSVICCDSVIDRYESATCFSRVTVNDLSIGEIAVENLLKLIENPERTIQLTQEVTFSPGETTAPPRAYELPVKPALTADEGV